MADVFISYSSEDKLTADAVCSALEKKEITCWIAPRDIIGGNYGAAIIKAINASKLVVLVFSSHANKSPQVGREIERAVSRGKVIYPLRIENVLPSEELELFISSEQWMDAFVPPLDDQLDRFSNNVKQLLSGTPTETSRTPKAAVHQPRETPSSPEASERRLFAKLDWNQLRVGILVTVGLVVLIGLIWNAYRDRNRTSGGAIAQPSPTIGVENTRSPHGAVTSGLITIRRAKELLKEFGHYNGQINDVDDDEFRKAVKSYQDANGLTPDGLLGPATATHLKGS